MMRFAEAVLEAALTAAFIIVFVLVTDWWRARRQRAKAHR